MTTSKIQLTTPDGPCTTEVVVPSGSGPWPAVIVFFDAGGLRPAQTRIAERIAAAGYVVLQPDLFHRSPPVSELVGEPVTLAAFSKVFQDDALRGRFMSGYYLPALAYENLERTVGAVLDHVAARPDVRGRVGTTGYCTGGNASVRAATIFGDRIAATAAFHPGGLVTDQPDSPHTRAKAIRSRVYLGPAIGDLPPEAEAKLRAELDAAPRPLRHRALRGEATCYAGRRRRGLRSARRRAALRRTRSALPRDAACLKERATPARAPGSGSARLDDSRHRRAQDQARPGDPACRRRRPPRPVHGAGRLDGRQRFAVGHPRRPSLLDRERAVDRKRVSPRARVDAPAQRVARRSHRRQAPLPRLLHPLHGGVDGLRRGALDARADRCPRPSRNGRRSPRPAHAADDGPSRRQAAGAACSATPSSPVLVAPVFGPVLAGAILQHASWPWIST